MNVHLILNSHIDPVWLWPWQAGMDSVIATCRSVCDRLDKHPDVIFTRGEAWAYDVIERTDPALFERIKKHIAGGQWEIVGGWWIQPDCNAASGWAWAKQMEMGQDYFQSRFGIVPRVGYNVDSFGHAATLPQLMRDHGQEYYVMMRPMANERTLPARVFRWRGYENGPEVTVFRIAGGYGAWELNLDFFKMAMEDLPEGIEDTMVFIGAGDHGGGPTEFQIEWIREHGNDLPGVNFIFSSPARFFKAIEGKIGSLPLVTGELQMHAVGCYSVYRPIKTALRRAEHIVHQAERSIAAGDLNQESMQKSWRHISFAQFHDTLGGTCLPSAYPQILDQLGYACSEADEALHFALRKKAVDLPDSTNQRIVAWNASDRPFHDFIEFEPWLEWRQLPDHTRLIGPGGAEVPYQRLLSEASVQNMVRLVFPASLAAGELTAIEIDKTDGQTPVAPADPAVVSDTTLRNSLVAIDPLNLTWGKVRLPKPALHLIEDFSDTWSHNRDRFDDKPADIAVWKDPELVDRGPVMASALQHGKIGDSTLFADWRVYAGQNFAELKLRVHWREEFKILKLVLPWEADEDRIDGISGGRLVRENDGLERPLRDLNVLSGRHGQLGIVSPDCYALDADRDRVRLTLLRSPILAWHDPDEGKSPRRVFGDGGIHEFRFRFSLAAQLDVDALDDQAIALQRPPTMADVTKGMPPHLKP